MFEHVRSTFLVEIFGRNFWSFFCIGPIIFLFGGPGGGFGGPGGGFGGPGDGFFSTGSSSGLPLLLPVLKPPPGPPKPPPGPPKPPPGPPSKKQTNKKTKNTV